MLARAAGPVPRCDDRFGRRPRQVMQVRGKQHPVDGWDVAPQVEGLRRRHELHDRLGQGNVPCLVEGGADVVGQMVEHPPRFGARQVAEKIVLHHLLERVRDGCVQRGLNRRLQTLLLVGHREGVGRQDEGGPVLGRRQRLRVGGERGPSRSGVDPGGLQRRQRRRQSLEKIFGRRSARAPARCDQRAEDRSQLRKHQHVPLRDGGRDVGHDLLHGPSQRLVREQACPCVPGHTLTQGMEAPTG